MEENPLLSLPEGMQIDQIQSSENEVRITARATHPTSCCPLCGSPSSSIHSRYRRTVRDVPCGGRRVQLTLCVRKVFCRNPLCERKVFTERLPELVCPWAQMTVRYSHSSRPSDWLPVAKGGPDWQHVWGYRPLAKRSCAASWICLISLFVPSFILEETIFRSCVAAGSVPSSSTWRAGGSWISYPIGRPKPQRPGCANNLI